MASLASDVSEPITLVSKNQTITPLQNKLLRQQLVTVVLSKISTRLSDMAKRDFAPPSALTKYFAGGGRISGGGGGIIHRWGMSEGDVRHHRSGVLSGGLKGRMRPLTVHMEMRGTSRHERRTSASSSSPTSSVSAASTPSVLNLFSRQPSIFLLGGLINLDSIFPGSVPLTGLVGGYTFSSSPIHIFVGNYLGSLTSVSIEGSSQTYATETVPASSLSSLLKPSSSKEDKDEYEVGVVSEHDDEWAYIMDQYRRDLQALASSYTPQGTQASFTRDMIDPSYMNAVEATSSNDDIFISSNPGDEAAHLWLNGYLPQDLLELTGFNANLTIVPTVIPVTYTSTPVVDDADYGALSLLQLRLLNGTLHTAMNVSVAASGSCVGSACFCVLLGASLCGQASTNNMPSFTNGVLSYYDWAYPASSSTYDDDAASLLFASSSSSDMMYTMSNSSSSNSTTVNLPRVRYLCPLKIGYIEVENTIIPTPTIPSSSSSSSYTAPSSSSTHSPFSENLSISGVVLVAEKSVDLTAKNPGSGDNLSIRQAQASMGMASEEDLLALSSWSDGSDMVIIGSAGNETVETEVAISISDDGMILVEEGAYMTIDADTKMTVTGGGSVSYQHYYSQLFAESMTLEGDAASNFMSDSALLHRRRHREDAVYSSLSSSSTLQGPGLYNKGLILLSRNSSRISVNGYIGQSAAGQVSD